MKEIQLTGDHVTFVDDEDYVWLSQWKWYAGQKRNRREAVRNEKDTDGHRYIVYMSREILGLKKGDTRRCDHKNHNPLDNRRANLRDCTHSENNRNTSSREYTSSKFLGVSWDKVNKKWRASISINGKPRNLGRFVFEELAALAHDFAAMTYYREFAHFNF